jgi:hypothetical protein
MFKIAVPALIATTLFMTACASNGASGKYNETTQDAAIGAAVGAAAGAVLAGDGNRTQGAVIGGVLGGATGAVYGCSRDRVCPWSSNNSYQSQLYYDSRADRRYFVDSQTGDTYWESGEFRSGR